MGPRWAGGGAVAQGATLLPALADIRTLLMVREDIKWRRQTQLELEERKWGVEKKALCNKRVFFGGGVGRRVILLTFLMVWNKREQADGTLVHLHKSSLGVQDFRLR